MPRYRNSLKSDKQEPREPHLTRRGFLALLGLGVVAGVGGFLAATLGGFLYPNALKIPPTVFSLGRPSDVLNSEGRTFIPKQKAFVEVRGGRVRVQTAICTHLGCTVNAVETGYSCPCHGSTYDLDGLNTGGPAPRPLTFFEVFRGASGELLADKSRKIADPAVSWFSPTV